MSDSHSVLVAVVTAEGHSSGDEMNACIVGVQLSEGEGLHLVKLSMESSIPLAWGECDVLLDLQDSLFLRSSPPRE